MKDVNSKLVILSFIVIVLTIFSFCSCGQEAPKVGRITVLASGNTDGYLKNCGCSAGQFGGAGRMARMMYEEQQIAQKSQATDQGLDNAVLLVDLGNIIDAGDSVKKIESAAIIQVMKTLPYVSVGLGFRELKYHQQELCDLIGESKLPFTAANLKFTTPKEGDDCSQQLNGLIQPYRIVSLENGYRIGIIHVLDQTYNRSLNPDYGAEVGEAALAVQAIMQQHASEAEFWVVTVADGGIGSQRAKEIGQIPGLGMVLGFERYTPPAETANILPLFADPPFQKSRDILRAVVKLDSQGKLSGMKADKLQLQESLKPTDEALAIIDATQPLLEAEANRVAEQSTQHSGPHPWYIGSTQCAMCHSDIALMLQETAHIHAYETLVAKDQHRSAACLPCHVVGYDTPDRGGFNVFDKEAQTLGVQCESCHGPGEYHATLMAGQPVPPDVADGGRNASGLLPTPADASSCIKCHDQMNSVGFTFEKYWPRIQHGKDASPDLTDTSKLSGSAGHATPAPPAGQAAKK
jgi:hypothetical protein